MCKYKGNTADAKLDAFGNAFIILDKIRDGKISLTNAKNDQVEFEWNLGDIEKRKQKT